MEICISEALGYLGAQDAPEDLRRQVKEAAKDLERALRPRYTYQVFPLERLPEGFRLAGTPLLLTGSTAERMLAQCSQAALLACTLGSLFDLRLNALQMRDMPKAVILDACGSAYVESGCGAAEKELAARFPGRYLTDRFSPGYGDLPLALQPEICTALDASRRLGLHVTQSLLLNPVKSVTAVIGLADQPQMARIRGCAFCQLRETCLYRKGGKRCGDGV